jgi:hypothetical protein
MPALSTFVALLAAAVSGGCAVLTTAEGSRLVLGSRASRAYVARVFREQNRLADELAFALADLPEGDGARERALAAAEAELLAACAPLNTLAAARRDARSLGARVEARLARAAPACEAQTASTRERIASDLGPVADP